MAAEEVARANADSSVELRLSEEEDARVAGDGSLTTRVAAEEVARADADSSLDLRVANDEAMLLNEISQREDDVARVQSRAIMHDGAESNGSTGNLDLAAYTSHGAVLVCSDSSLVTQFVSDFASSAKLDFYKRLRVFQNGIIQIPDSSNIDAAGTGLRYATAADLGGAGSFSGDFIISSDGHIKFNGGLTDGVSSWAIMYG